jgi:hypothetical protein
MTLLENIKTVCVIDDDKIYVYGLKKLISIKQLCPNLIEFPNGKEAMDFLVNPENQGALPDIITVYMVSSSINDDDINRAKSISDVSDYIVKPVSPAKLIELFNLAA